MEQCSLRMGASQVVITPPIGTPMAGYLQREGPSEGIIDDLCMQALVLHKGADPLVLLSLDTLSVDETFGALVARALALPRERVIVAATHTHAGPRVMPGGEVLDPHPAGTDTTLRDLWVAHAVGAVGWAMRVAGPVSLAWGRATVDAVGGDRNDPTQAVDRELTVVALRDRSSDDPLAIILNYACHPTVLSAKNRCFSTDFVGPLRLAMGGRPASYAGSSSCPVVMFLNGAAGNVSTRFHRQEQSVAEAIRLGTRIASAAQSVRLHRLETQDDWDLRAVRHEITVRLRSMPDAQAAQAALTTAEEAYARGTATGCDPGTMRILRTRVEGALRQARLSAAARPGAQEASSLVGVSQWAFGPLALVAVPAELFSSLGQRIKRNPWFPATLVAGYSDGMVGYIPDREGYQSASYEALSTTLQPGEGEALCDAVLAELRNM